MSSPKSILLAEHDPHDVVLTLEALTEIHMACQVEQVIEAVKQAGAFWTVLDERPPGSVRKELWK